MVLPVPRVQLAPTPVTWCPQRPVFIPVPDKPPVENSFPSHSLNVQLSLDVANVTKSLFSSVAIENVKPFSRTPPEKFSPRPLVCLSFAARTTQAPDGLRSFPPSLLVQIDGLLFATFRERLERDVCASSSQDSFCPFWGPSFSPASSFCGLYLPPPALLDDVLCACRLERGLGVFIGHYDSAAISSLLADASVLLRFAFPHSIFADWCGVFCSFAYAGRAVRRKPHSVFDVHVITDGCVPAKIGLLPFCPARMSPSPFVPTRDSDTHKASPSLPLFLGVPHPVQVSSWDSLTMAMCAASYPFRDVADLCVSAASSSGSVSRFAGDRQKCVLARNSPLSPLQWDKIRSKFLDDVSRQRMLGPFPRCPFPNEWCNAQARQISLSTRPKDKWDPLSERFRVISSLSVHKPASVNDLVFSPKLVSFHLQGTNLRDILASFGQDASFFCIDQVEAFRSNKINLDDAHLYVYCVPHSTGDEWFIDLTACFGGIVPEWSYAVEVAILKWHLQNDPLIVGPNFNATSLQGYVDNWFLIGSRNDSSFVSRWDHLKSLFVKLGVDMHEEQRSVTGPVNAIGWDWDTHLHVFSCPLGKLDAARKLISGWAARSLSGGCFTINEIEKLVGLLRWVSTACPLILPVVAYIQAFGYTIPTSRGSAPLDARANESVQFIDSFFASWNGLCPIFAGFLPTCSYEFLLRSDASTNDGCGGFCLPFTPSACGFLALYHAWDSSERAAALGHSNTPVRESTLFFELLGLLYLLEHVVVFLHGKRVQFECDSEPAIRALSKGFSKMPLCMGLIRRFWLLCPSHHVTPRFEHILARYNAIADHLSHLRVPQAIDAALSEFNVGFTVPPYSLLSLPTRL